MKKNRYILIVFSLVAAVFLFEYYFLEPKSGMLRESINSQYYALQKYRHLIEGAGITEDEIRSSIDEMKNIEKRLIQEKSEFLATAKLQNRISDFSDKAGLKVLIIKPLSPIKLNSHYTNIPVYFEGRGNIKQISDLLQSIESTNLMIKIDKLNLSVINRQKPKDLKFKIQVSGLIKL